MTMGTHSRNASLLVSKVIIYLYQFPSITTYAYKGTKKFIYIYLVIYNIYIVLFLFIPIALRMAKTLWSFGRSECNRVKDMGRIIHHNKTEVFTFQKVQKNTDRYLRSNLIKVYTV